MNTLHKSWNQMLTNKKGFTLLEVMVAVIVATLIMGSVYNFYLQGWRLTEKSFNQSSAQERAVKVMQEIDMGFYSDSIQGTVPGLKAASIAEVNSNGSKLTYHTVEGYIVIYNVKDDTLDRQVAVKESEEIKVISEEPVAENINFSVSQNKTDAPDLLQVELSIKEGINQQTDGEITLKTEIFLRNYDENSDSE